MERIFKIKTKTTPDPRVQYPSERRYSASIVLGLSVVFVQLFLYSVLMGTLIVHRLALHETESLANETSPNATRTDDGAANRLHEKIARDLRPGSAGEYYVNVPALVCAGCFVMALGAAFSSATGLLAWKRWYIDHNITLFFLSTTFSALTSAISLLVSTLGALDVERAASPVTLSVATNVVVLSAVGVAWSGLSTNVAYKGMRNGYPDDVVLSKGGRTVEVSTVRKGGKGCGPLPPDIVSHFPASGKLAKYLPRQEDGNLPKAESNREYRGESE
ncbi:hypothetical protein NQ318_003849 [Aromia moschata]|uniref:Transmembrane protein n=1 Tax=Aromia moschata TaxID=1265417 RepID=A0AAV8Z7G8_9CUCU|nr:hypothetical protein NQ318_003849 [Aromia moschata]